MVICVFPPKISPKEKHTKSSGCRSRFRLHELRKCDLDLSSQARRCLPNAGETASGKGLFQACDRSLESFFGLRICGIFMDLGFWTQDLWNHTNIAELFRFSGSVNDYTLPILRDLMGTYCVLLYLTVSPISIQKWDCME